MSFPEPWRASGIVAAVLAALAFSLAGCASNRPRSFAPAADSDVERVLAAWRGAVARAGTLPSSRMLYEARLSQGLLRISGTLAVKQSPGLMQASLTGPFGSPVAVYVDGALRGEKIKPVVIAPEQLRSLLAGVWNASAPRVQGVSGADALLVWESGQHVEGVLDVLHARFELISVFTPEGTVTASYSGQFDPWPSRIDVEDASNGGRLRLALLAREALR